MATHHTDAGAGAATERAVEPMAPSVVSTPAVAYEQIAQLAYQYWQERGCPIGSPEGDWLRAEAELQRQATGT
jgi:hypothetical protein